MDVDVQGSSECLEPKTVSYLALPESDQNETYRLQYSQKSLQQGSKLRAKDSTNGRRCPQILKHLGFFHWINIDASYEVLLLSVGVIGYPMLVSFASSSN